MPTGLFELAASHLWAIAPQALETILAVAGRYNPDSPEAVSAKLGRPLGNSQSATVRDGVAIIPVAGPMFRYANLFTQISGATSMELLAKEFNQAVEDPGVKAILLEVDSPGGMVNGIADLASHIMAARQTKPVWAYVSNQGQSAAYWLASAASRVVVSPTAQVGSIGVVASAPGARKGDDIQFVSSVSPKKRPNLGTADGLSQIQRQIDATGEVFVAAVAAQRGISVDKVLADFGQGDSFIGAAAVAAGLADAVGTFEETLATLAGKANSAGSSPQGGRTMPKSYREAWAAGEVQTITAGELKEQHPELHKTIAAEALAGQPDAAAQVSAERERILALAAGMLGAEAGAKFRAAAEAGLTAEQAKTLGVTLAPPAADGPHLGAKAESILAALKDSAEQPITPSQNKAAEPQPETWPALVAAHASEHQCSQAEAIKAIEAKHPGLRGKYLAAINQK